jgi:hypothetical protein
LDPKNEKEAAFELIFCHQSSVKKASKPTENQPFLIISI